MQKPEKSGLQQKNSRIFVDIYKKMRIISNCMDTQKDTPQEMSRAALMAACKGRKMIAGARQLKKALASGKVQAVFLALDADPGMTEPLRLCARSIKRRFSGFAPWRTWDVPAGLMWVRLLLQP